MPAPQMPTRNSADFLLGQTQTRDTYFNRLARHISQFRFYPRAAADNNQRGRVVARLTISRDGRLIDVKVDKSSGWPIIDAAEVEAIRKAAPFPPVPADMPGDPLTLILASNYDLTMPKSR